MTSANTGRERSNNTAILMIDQTYRRILSKDKICIFKIIEMKLIAPGWKIYWQYEERK